MTGSRSLLRFASKSRTEFRRQAARRKRVLFLESLEERSLLATISYAVPAGTAGNQNFGGSLGMDFNVTSPITVTNLGAFDASSNGINGTINVRLYDRTAPGVPMASAAFSGVAQQLVGGNRFLPIAALNLPAGFQGRIVADGYNGAELNGNSGGGAPVWTTNAGGALTFTNGGFFDVSAGVYPNSADGGPANRYAAGTFIFVPQTLTTTYADDSWTGFSAGQVILDADPGTAGDQSAVFGIDAFATISGAVTAAPATGTIIVNGGTYTEAATLSGTQTLEISGPAEVVTIDTLTTAAGQTVVLEGTAALTVGNAANFALAGNITGNGTLTKAGAGTLTLSGTNSYSGGTTVNAGKLQITAGNPAPGNLTVNGGTYSIANNTFNGFDLTKTITINAGGTVSADSSANNAFNIGNLILNGGTLTSANGVSGPANDGGFGNWLFRGVVVGGSAVSTISATQVAIVSNDFNVADSVGGVGTDLLVSAKIISGALIKNGVGTMTLTGGNTYTAATTVSQGTLSINQVGPGSNNANVGAGANTQLTTASIAVASGAVVNFNTGGNFSSSNTGTTLTGAGTIRLSSGVWWLGNPAGGTVISMSAGGLIDVVAGTMKNDYSNAVWTANLASLNVATGANFDLRNNNVVVGALTGGGTVFDAGFTNSLTLGAANGTGVFTGALGAGGTTVNVIKNGTGSQSFNGPTSYTGTTTVNQGTLTFNQLTTGTNNANVAGLGGGQLATSTLAIGAGAVVNLNPNVNFSSANAGTAISGAGTLRLQSGIWWMGNAGGGTAVSMSAGGLIDIQAGTIKNDYSNANWAANLSAMNVAAGATLNLRNNNVNIDTLTGAGSIFNDFATNTLTIGVNNGTGTTYTGSIVNSAGVILLAKAGTGTQTLSGAGITYTGATTVNAGQLILSQTTGYNSPTTVANAATLTFTGTADFNIPGGGATILLNNGSTLQNTNPNNWTVHNAAITVAAGASVVINQTSNATGAAGRGFYLDGGLKGTGTVTINAANAGSGVSFRNNNTTFAGTMIVNGIASTTPFAGSGIGVGGNTTALINADIQLNGTMELLNQGIGWANGAPGDFWMGALSGGGTMVGNFTAGGQTRVRLGNTNNNGVFTGTIANGNGNVIVMTKNGTGVQTFSGAGTIYTGATTVAAGELILFNATTYNSPTTVNSGAKLTFGGNANMQNNNTAATILLNNGATLQNTNPNNWTVINGAVTVPAGASATINHTVNATATPTRGFYLDGGLKGSGTVTINATNAGSGVNFRNNNTTFDGTMIVNGIASATVFAGSGIGVGGNTTGLINADIQLNGTMELLNQGIGWANTGSGLFNMDALSGAGVIVGNYTAAGITQLRLGNNNGTSTFSGSIVDGTGNVVSLVKNGTGTLTLSGTNTYTGTTTVAAGVLQLQNGNAISNTAGAVSVSLGATLQLLTNETISSYAGAGDIGAGTNDSTLALGNNVLTTTAGVSIANVTSAGTGGIVAGTAITDADDDNNVTGPGIFLQAGTGIGTAVDPIETAISNFEASTGTGGVFVSNTGALAVGNVTGTLNGVDVTGASGAISLVATGSINVISFDEDISGPSDITLNAQGATSDVTTSGSNSISTIRTSGAAALLSLSAGRDVIIGLPNPAGYGDSLSAGAILVTAGRDFVLQQDSFLDVNGPGTNTVNAGRDIILFNDNSNTRLTTQGGVISLTANRNVVANVRGFQLNTIDSTQGGVTPAGANVNITATTGSISIGDGISAGTAGTLTLVAGTSITDSTPAGLNPLTGLNLVATAATGITGPLETAVTRLEASGGTGGVFVANFGNLTIGGIGPMVGVSATGGDIVVTASGSLTVSENVAASGAGTDVTLTAIDAAAAGQNLIVSAGVLISSAAASVTLNAGDDATVTGNVTSGTTTTMNVDAGNADAGTGGTLVITGVVTTPAVGSGGGAFLNGQTDFDTFTFNPQTTTEFRLFGNLPVSTVTGDTLVMNVSGTTNPNLTVPGSLAPYSGNGSGAWSFTSPHRPVLFGSIEQSTITGNYHLTFDNSVNPVANLFVMRDNTQANVQLRNGSAGGAVVYQGSLATILSLRVLGSGGNDIVTVDDINTLPDFAGTVPGVTDNGNLGGTAEFLFDGLGGTDTLVFNINGATAAQTYAIGNGTGAAGLEGELQTIASGLTLQSYFQNVELAQRTGIGATPGGLSILGDSSGNAFSTQANAALTRTSSTGYTPFEFSGNNFNALTISSLAGIDTVDLISLGTGQTNNPPINLNGGTEDDTLRVRSTSGNTGVVTLNGNEGSDLFQLFDAANTVDNIAGPVVVDGTDGNLGGNTDTLTIVDSGDGSADNVVIAAVNSGVSQDYAVEGINTVTGNDVVLRNVDVLNYTSTSASDAIDGRFVNTVPQHDLNTVSLSGWLGADQFLLFTSDQIGGTAPTPSGTASGVANISLFGDAPGNPNAGDGNDIFGATPVGVVGTGVTNVGLVVPDTTRMIRPSVTTSIAIDGGQPTGLAAPLGDVIGDVNNVDISALPNSTPVIVSTFSPGTVAAAGISPLTWTQIEDINVVDQGKLTNVQMGDLFARTTPAADLVQITRNPTLLNPNQVRLRITATIGNYSASNKTIIYGGGANDTITQSNLTIPAEFYGEAGDDYLSGAMNNDWLVGGLGNDRINGSGGDNVIWGDNSPTNPGDLTPQDGAVGGNDQLSGLGGNDVFYAGAGDDSVSAGAGNDYVSGGQGNDTLDGNDGDDRLYGAAGNDILSGHAGNDLLSGSGGDDKLFSAAGNDVLFGGTGLDQIDGGDGNDLLVSGSVANENSTWTSVANTTTYSAATYTSGSDNDAALLTLLTQWGSSSNRSSIGAISHDGVNDDLLGYTGDDDFCWETVDVLDNPPGLTPSDFNAFGMGTDERFGPT